MCSLFWIFPLACLGMMVLMFVLMGRGMGCMPSMRASSRREKLGEPSAEGGSSRRPGP